MGSDDRRTILLAAGGTGGHLFPAQALAEALIRRGYRIVLATDGRVERYGGDFPAEATHVIESATVASRSPIAMAKTGISLARGVRQAHALIGKIGPAAVVGFGGYPSFPPLMAAVLRGVPTALHEQNAVLGRANRMLAGRVTAVATSFPNVQHTEDLAPGVVELTGNPVRARVIDAARTPYREPTEPGSFDLLVFGGSQGARYMSDTVPGAVAMMPAELRSRLRVVQQCREEDLQRVFDTYDRMGVATQCDSFFADLPQRIADSHLVIARSGASSVAEISVIGRPSILVPLPHSLDNDQKLNATRLAEVGGAWCFAQADLDAGRLAAELTQLMTQPGRLAEAAAAAKALGRPDADERLADVVERIAGRRSTRERA